MSSVAAAAALATSRKRQQRPHKFEVNPAQRKRQHTRLIRYDVLLSNFVSFSMMFYC